MHWIEREAQEAEAGFYASLGLAPTRPSLSSTEFARNVLRLERARPVFAPGWTPPARPLLPDPGLCYSCGEHGERGYDERGWPACAPCGGTRTSAELGEPQP